jgi:predicted LPLAT superfamily acyltransferase
LHADRIQDGQKTYLLPFLNGKAEFPAGPFVMAHKFKVPITFVFAVKESNRQYALSATDLMLQAESPEEIAAAYVKRLEDMVRKYPNQWFNFYEYYVN